ncbi:MAG: PRC-barrel domain-containing protein [Pseudomonadota bacterium]
MTASLVSSENVEGTDVYGPGRDKIGNIDHLMIDKQSGRVAYAVMTFGGFLGLGESKYPMPWSKLSYDNGVDGYMTDVTEEQVKNAPDYDEQSFANREWETRTHDHYQTHPYWAV